VVENNKTTLLKMRGITKRFPGVRALKSVDFDLQAGEVHVLLGENGAGKSTLIKILSGAYQLDDGGIFIDGSPVRINNPHHASALGISTIYQETNLVPSLSVAENIFLGRLPRIPFLGVVKNKKIVDDSKDILAQLGVHIPTDALVGVLSIAQKQLVEIAKAVSQKTKILIMDEPTSALTAHEIENLFQLVRKLRANGTGIIYISHRFEEFNEIGDRITVMRDGKKIDTASVADTSDNELIQMMIGRRLDEKFPNRAVTIGEEVLKVKNLSVNGIFNNINLNLHKGEILGVMGVVGSGSEAIAYAVAGGLQVDFGEKYLNGMKVEIKSPQDAIKHHIGLLTEDRKSLGLMLKLSVRENITLSSLDQINRLGFLSLAKEEHISNQYIKKLNILTPSGQTITENLSGGNQQKVVIAKWLCRKINILLCVEPTRGVDIGAKVEIYSLLNKLVTEGASVIIFSSDRDEIIGMCDRIIVIRKGEIVAEVPREKFSREEISSYAFGEMFKKQIQAS
jgi:ribose transport system ATP-binding protein